MRRLAFGTALAISLAAVFSLGRIGYAAGGDFSLDFTAAAPLTYDHSTGGGAYNDRTVGRDKDIVESLEGGDFACLDVVTFLTQVTVDAGASGTQAIRLNFEFTDHSTGQQGVALADNDPQPGGTSGAINVNPPDSGTNDFGAAASVGNIVEGTLGTEFIKPATFLRSVDVGGLDPGDTVVVRTDVRIHCNGQSPTGNMQARLASASVISGVGGTVTDAIPSGDQTVPFKHVGDIKPPACDPKTDPNCK